MAGSVGLLGVAVSGLQAANRALTTIGHNIANVNTPGYSRQRTDVVARPPQLVGGNFVGSGVEIVNTRRVYDVFATNQLRISSASAGYADAYQGLAQGLDNLLADPDTGLEAPLQGFFDAAHDLANDPASPVGRQALIGAGEGLQARVGVLEQALVALDRQVNDRIGSAIGEVNAYARALADLNREVLVARGRGDAVRPNDLLDQRDELVRQLAEKVAVSTVEQDDGSLTVMTGSGQVLVVGTRAQELVAARGSYDPTRLEVGYRVGSDTAIVSGLLTGGELGALVQFRERLLDPAYNGVGRLALGIAETFNDQHAQGMDLRGRVGGELFATLDGSGAAAIDVRGHPDNGAGASVSVQISDVALVTTSDYLLERSGGVVSVTRLSDGQALTLADLAGEGLAVSAAGLADGDRFLIRPTRAAVRQFALAIRDPSAIAARGVDLSAAAGAGNTGDAALTGLGGVPGAALPAATSVTLTYRDALAALGGAPGFDAGPYGALAYDPATEAAGKSFTLSPPGLRLTVAGSPVDGDTLSVQARAGGVGDNRNALALAALPTLGLLDRGDATYGDAYGALVGQVGTATRQAQVNQAAQRTLLEEATRARETAAGVNLDEEAADILRFQQSYQASAQVIAAASSLFDTLLQVVSR
jgi:flagellar hook-associated protein 1 FlgK